METLLVAESAAAAQATLCILGEDNLGSDSATLPASQQSIKAYVDALPASGAVVQVLNTQTGTIQYFGSAIVIPNDDTIPQKTEGDEVMTLAITPTSATNKLKIEIVAFFAHSNSETCAALFQDATANSLACSLVPAFTM